MNAVVTLTNNCPQGLSHILLRLGHKLSPSTTPSNPPAISLLSTPDVRAPLNVTRCIPFHSSTSSLPYTTSRSEVGLPGTTGIRLHCTFLLLRRVRLLRAVRALRWRRLLGRACLFRYAAHFRGDKHTYYFQRIPSFFFYPFNHNIMPPHFQSATAGAICGGGRYLQRHSLCSRG